jgi:trk system potassium uptake protein TrkH
MRQIPLPGDVLQGARRYVLELTPQRALILSFVSLSLLGTFLLKLPIASAQPTSWSQALFTAVSASTVTGLVVLDTGSHFTLFGHWVLIFLMQAGGLGLMTFGLLIISWLMDGSGSANGRLCGR